MFGSEAIRIEDAINRINRFRDGEFLLVIKLLSQRAQLFADKVLFDHRGQIHLARWPLIGR